MHFNAEHVVALGFFIFILVLVYYGAHRIAIDSLDNRIKSVKDQLAEAEALRAEAQSLLASFAQKRQDAEAEASAIIAQAQEEAQRLAEEAKIRTNEYITRRTRQAEEKIALAETQAQQDVKAAAAEAAVKAAELVLKDQTAGAAGQKLVNDSIQNIGARLKPQAA